MKLNTKRTVIIGFAFMSILAFWQFYDQVIPYILENTFGLSTFATNSIMTIDNILAIFMLPIFGAISDKTRSRLGKRTPFILFGTIAAVILMTALAIFQEQRIFWGFFIGLLLLLLTMSTYRTPAVAYMPDVTPKPLRSKANAIINLVGYVGGMFSMGVMMVLLKSHKDEAGNTVYDSSFTPVFLIVAGFMLISVLLLVFLIKENKVLAETKIDDGPETEEQGEKGKKLPESVFKSLVLILSSVFLWFFAYNSVTTSFSRYCMSVWNADIGTSSGYLMAATISAIVAFVPLGMLSSKVGRKATILIGITVMTACYGSAIFIKHQTPIMYAIFGIVGIGWAAINVNSFPMVVEMCHGGDVGKYTGLYYTFSMAAQITTPFISGLLIDKLSLGYEILFPYAALFSALSFVTMYFVKHGDVKPQAKKSVLENFDMED